jgi:hypothetical protein
MKQKNVTQLKGGLHKDNSSIDTPKGTYQYALNAVNETEVGDLLFLSNEESNESCGDLPNGYVPISKVYIGNNKTMIFSVSADNDISEIGIRDSECGYTTHVNADLGFKITNQIDATYRLRRGCETTVYWVDGKNNKPMYYVVEKPQQFQDGDGNWLKNKFELQRSFNKVPKFQDIELLNSGGQLNAGSVNVAIQYLDENLNPTEWIITSEVVKVYNDDTTESFLDIEGSINIDTGADIENYRDFEATDKALKVVLDNLDETFLYYRLAFIEANSGSGLISSISYTENLPIQNKIFIYTGINFSTKGTENEIKAFNSIIESAGSIEQVDNMLILGNTQGKEINFCELQSHASLIKADMTTRKVLLNQMIDKANTKSPTATFEGIGYQPGEIYSFGIVYIFEDGTQTPVYHIPGKSHNIVDTNMNNVSEDFIFKPGVNGQKVYPMALNNKSLNSVYNDNSTCSSGNYWGVDSVGDTLKFAKVRHHRFPLRSKLGLDLVTLENTVGGENEYYQVELRITGDLITHKICDQTAIDAGECSVIGEEVPLAPFQARVTYTAGGVEDTMVINILPSDYIGENLTTTIDLSDYSNFNLLNNIVITSIEESLEDGTIVTVGASGGTGDSEHGSLTYLATIVPATFNSETRVYSSEIFGVQFSGISVPPETKGGKIIGYNIVRNERTETEKTILDSAVIIPSVVNDKYISHGLLFPEFAGERKISDRVYGLLNPEYKFNNVKYSEFTEMKQEGQFTLSDRLKSKSRYLDTSDGTSYDSSVHKSGRGNDEDGWSLKAITRDNITEFKKIYTGFNFIQDDIEDVFYLDALQSKEVELEDEENLNTVYNVSGDNKIGMIQLKEDNSSLIDDTLPYVYLTREVADSYSTFRSLPYYKTSINMHNFYEEDGTVDSDSDTAVEFNGDSYLTPMRYLNTMWWDNRVAKRAGKTSVWSFVVGALLVVVGAILTVFGVGVVVIGAGIAVIGGGALFISSGIKRDTLVRAYYDEYDKGLRETTLDDWVSHEYVDLPCQGYGKSTCDTPEDDEVQWISDCVTDIWFESQVNISLRYGMTTGSTTFLNAPGKIETGNTEIERAREHFGIYKQKDVSIYPFNKLDTHIMKKLSAFNPEREDSREYIGHPLGEWYEINPDFNRTNKQKVFFHLPIEYDCCSDCQEDYPHRVHYSQQSFQEELTDNFRVFLPNDYRDMEGETGEITDLFRIKNNIYIHTEEGLWHQPQNYQERTTGDILSFLGTGGYFNVPARKILDDNKSSGGTKHREATLKTKHGVFFVSENEGKIYQFDGNKLEAITDIGMSNWFKENMKLQLVEDYYNSDGKEYPYNNNPSNPHGVGYISVYDTKKERIIFSKKDKILSDVITTGEDFEICTPNNNNMVIFNNYQQTIDTYIGNGWEYAGLEDCKMKFEKLTLTSETQTGETITTTTIASDTIVIPFFDTTSMSSSDITNISATLDTWFPGFKASINGGDNTITFQNPGTWNRWATELWAQDPAQLTLDNVGVGLNVLLLVFVDETNASYHGNSLSSPMDAPSTPYTQNTANFVDNLHSQFNTFTAINYPILQSTGSNKEYLQHTIAAIEAKNMTSEEVDALIPNSLFTEAEWNTLKANLQSNPYVGQPILKNYGWLYKEDRISGVDNNGSTECPIDGVSVITPCQFTLDVQFLLSTQITSSIDIDVLIPSTIIEYVTGDPVALEKADNSWAMSFSLKTKVWVSWHSYLPDFFYYIAEKFYSWKAGKTSSFWKHNKKGHYQNFYGERKPFSVEYTAMSEPLKTKIWDDITLHTEAKRYNVSMGEYVEVKDVTFNKGIFYNTRQCTGELDLKVKGTGIDDEDYMSQQVVDVDPGTIIIDKNEKDWSLNDIRDIRIDYEQPIFNSDVLARQGNYYTDKILNSSALDENKDWQQLESLRDKYLVVRLIFDTFDDVKLVMNYSVENETDSLS